MPHKCGIWGKGRKLLLANQKNNIFFAFFLHNSISYHLRGFRYYGMKWIDAILFVGSLLMLSSCGGKMEESAVKEDEPCKECGGSGYVSDLCVVCSGRGQEVCAACKGVGKTHCSVCYGDKYVSCEACSGSGSLACSICSGSGNSSWGNGVCSSCNGSGRDYCFSCHGSGTRECYACQGTGSDFCMECKGEGLRECIHCGGKGGVRVECQACRYSTD